MLPDGTCTRLPGGAGSHSGGSHSGASGALEEAAARGMDSGGRNSSGAPNSTLSESQGSAILISFIYSVVCLVGLC